MWRIRFAWFKRMAGKKGGIQNENEEEEGQPISENVGEKPEEVKSGESMAEFIKKLKKIWKKLLKRYPQMLKNMKKTQKKLRKNGMAYYKKFKPLSKR